MLREHNISALADVRSVPASKFSPHFSKEKIKLNVVAAGLSYVFLGKELGGRPTSYEYFSGSKADYEKMARAPTYIDGIERLLRGKERFTIAMMCSEHDPLDCHRCLLVSRTLLSRGVNTKHILQTGEIKTQTEIEKNLLTLSKKTSLDMFQDSAEILDQAYRDRAMKIAYSSDEAA